MKRIFILFVLVIVCFTARQFVALEHEPVYVQPWFTATITNQSESIFLISGYNHTDSLQSDILSPGRAQEFKISDDKKVQIATPSGIYQILIHSYFSSDGSPLNPCAVFEKIKAGQVSNKIGPVLMFRTYFKIAPFGERLDFEIRKKDAVLLITPKAPIMPETALQRPVQSFIPPFVS